MKKKRRSRRWRNLPWWYRIPTHVWILVEVLVTILILHYTHISISDLLRLFRLFV